MKNNIFKKSLSVFMAVMMLLSCWVFIAPEHAHAATAGNYTMKFSVTVSNGADGGSIQLYYYPWKTDGSGFDTSNPQVYGGDSAATLASIFNSEGGAGDHVVDDIPGFPYRILFTATNSSLNKFDIWVDIYFMGTKVSAVDLNKDWGGDVNNHEVLYGTTGWTLPYASTITGLKDETLQLEKTGTKSSVQTGVVKDQYGVNWNVPPSYTITTPSGGTPVNVTKTDQGDGTTVAAGLTALVAANGYTASNGYIDVTLEATSGTTASQTCTIRFKSPTYTVTFYDATDGVLATKNCYYNGGVVAPDSPAKAPDDTYHYAFSNWDKTFTSGITADTGVKPVYTKTAHTYEGAYKSNNAGKHNRKCTGCDVHGLNGKKDETEFCTFGSWTISGSTFTHTCKHCDYVESQTHTFDKKELSEEAMITQETCTEKGKYYYTCSTCATPHTSKDYTDTTFEVDPIGHHYNDKGETVAHTCSNNGYVVYYCVDCGDSMNDYYKRNADNTYALDTNGNKVLIDPAAHNFNINISYKDGTYHGYECLGHGGVACDKADAEGNMPAWDLDNLVEHDYTIPVSGANDKAATCTTPGIATYRCDCSTEATKEITVESDPNAHDFTGPLVSANDQYHAHSCANGCGKYGEVDDGKQVADLATTPHNLQRREISGDKVNHELYCADNCGYTTTEAHTWTETGRDGLTCTTPGTAHYECKYCKATKDENLPAINHANKQHVAANAPTCEAVGNIEYYYCPDCQLYSTDGSFADDTIIKLEDTVVDALDHDFSNTSASNAKSLNNGTHNYKCSRCDAQGIVENGEQKKDGFVSCNYGEYITSATDHSRTCADCGYTETESHDAYWTAWVSDNAAGTTAGTHSRYCSKCNRTQENVDCDYEIAKDENGVEIDVDSTCVTPGYTTYKCPDCGHGYTVIKALDSSNHEGNLDETKKIFIVDTASTCKEEGVGHWECVCGTKLGESEAIEIDPENHADYGTTTTGAVTPTCKVEGFTGEVTCNGCNEVISENKSLGYDKNNHVNKTEYAQQDPTCTEIGYTAYFVCNDCETVVGKKQIAALGHDYNSGKAVKLEGDIHSYECVRYDDCQTIGIDKKTDAYEACSGGEASCTALAKCDACGDTHGELKLHSFTSGTYQVYDVDGVQYHNQKCLTCDAYGTGYVVDGKEACSGGEATCESAAECSVCKHSYGEALGHDFSMAKNRVHYAENNSHNWKCSRCDKYGIVNDEGAQEVNGTVACVVTETVTPPTCTEAGSISYTCEYCAHQWTVEGDAATGHKYTQKIIDDAHVKSTSTCTGATVYWYDCIGCDKNAKDLGITNDPSLYYENGSAAGHTWEGKDYLYLATEATCTKNETYYVYCTACPEDEVAINYNETFEKPDSKLSHEWEETKTYLQSAADCDNAVVYYKECKNCHDSSENHDGATWTDGKALGHDFKGEVVDVAHRKNKANCEAPATYYYDCTRCDANAKLLTDGTADDYTYTKGEVDPDNHTSLTLVAFKAATCTEDGHSAHKKCYVVDGEGGCGKEIGKVVYKATGHDFTGEYTHIEGTDTHKQACANDGCDKFGDAVTCTFGEWKQVEGTATHSRSCVCGNTEVEACDGGTSSCTEKATCSTCLGKYGTTSDHNYPDEWTSDGEGSGTHSKTCENCSATQTEGCSGGTATCSKKAVCTKCDVEYGEFTDHKFVNYVDSKAATCYTNKEKTAKCEYCTAEDTVEIPNSKLSHVMSEYVVTTEPTCQDEGVQTSTCTLNCGYSVDQTIPADKSKHVESEWIKDDASANCATGIKYYKECTVCGEELETKTEAGAHEWDSTVVSKPTCITDGYINYVCTLCGFTKTEWPEELKAAGEHTWGDIITTKAATCSNKGRGYYECTVCGAQSENVEIDKLAHGPENDVDLNGDGKLDNTRIIDPVAPTCDTRGHNGYWECLNCSYTSRESSAYVEYPALGHNDANGDGRCDDCTFVIYDSDGDKDIDGSCGCLCHNDSWFGQLIYKIVRFFWKIFGMKESCNCGYEHY